LFSSYLSPSTTITMARTKQAAKKLTGGGSGKRQLATMRAAKAPRSVIPSFVSLIPPSRHQLTEAQVKNYKFLIFEKPEHRRFEMGDDTFERFRVTVKDKDDNILGFIPLPIKYLGEWAIAAHGMYESHQV
jgi:hypothetical protein